MGYATKFRRKRRLAVKLQGGLCFWCGIEMLTFAEAGYSQSHPQLCTAEHLTPQSVKNDDSAKNVVAACFKCNTARKDHPLEIWLPRVAFRLKQAGNPQHMVGILRHLAQCGIDLAIGHLRMDPDTAKALPVPPQKEPAPAP